ncbi:ATP-binding cassette domain-containing protein [Cochlodiniinecator piscidefendens]|uniref:ATP-binding cassette domain-containing protein n=1 Tax=Cochlodiniinecator piscidefendens TaxID=2715756 RepID=UPI00140A914D|nr:ATP-binding cassette domain-containing protein [Cochlodiniinecator piscidefendens]
MKTEAGLHFDHVSIAKAGQVLVELNELIAPGEVLSVMGPSGSGKSTLLSSVIGTLDKAFCLTGQIRLDGRDITGLPPEQRHIGILFQDDLLFPHLSVGANLAFGLRRSHQKGADCVATINTALADVGLEGFADRDPATLSGGQKARVALMRMLLSQPSALLLDEPFSGLDTELRAQMRQLVYERAKAQKVPVLLVTHDIEDAEASGGRIVRIGQN